MKNDLNFLMLSLTKLKKKILCILILNTQSESRVIVLTAHSKPTENDTLTSIKL